jgi:hypothetical protein
MDLSPIAEVIAKIQHHGATKKPQHRSSATATLSANFHAKERATSSGSNGPLSRLLAL